MSFRWVIRLLCGVMLAMFAVLTADAQALDATSGPRPMLPEGELRVGIDPTAPPIIFSRDERITGLEADFARGFARELGVPLNFVIMEFDELIPALTEGKIDIIMSGMTATDIRSIQVNFARPFLITGQMPLVRAKDLSRYPTTMALMNAQVLIGVEEGTTGDFYVSENMTFADRVPFDDILRAADALAAERIGMVVTDAPTVWWLASQRQSAGLTPVAALLSRETLAWGVAKDNPRLLAAA
ncbi:MAG: transporter substrate-binding domain-containing protein, partial [Puniceicoccales bacterium]